MHEYKKLNVWIESIELVTSVYQITKNYPKEEKFGLVSQINRSSVSIPSNIAEGAGRNTKGEFKNFLGNATGSLYELETQLLVSKNLNYITTDTYGELVEKIKMIRKMLYKLIKSLN